MLWLFERKPLFFHNKRLKNVINGPNGPSDGLGAVEAGMKLHYIAMRLVKTVLVAIAVVLLSFFLIRLAPGDAATVMAGQAGYADEAFMKSLRAEYGLDQPMPVQLWKYVDRGGAWRSGHVLCAQPAGVWRSSWSGCPTPCCWMPSRWWSLRRAASGWAAWRRASPDRR